MTEKRSSWLPDKSALPFCGSALDQHRVKLLPECKRIDRWVAIELRLDRLVELAQPSTGGRALGCPRKAHDPSDQRVVAAVGPSIGLRKQFIEAM